MRHAKHSYSLNKSFSLRKALVLSLAKNLLKYQSIKTTQNRAKAAQQVVEKLITMGKESSLAKKRMAYKLLGDHQLVSLLFNDIAPRFKDKIGGYTRILKLANRRGDDAKIAVFELTRIKEAVKKAKTEKEAKNIAAATEVKSVSDETAGEKKTKTEPVVSEKHPLQKKPDKNFLRGIRNIFKRERDSL